MKHGDTPERQQSALVLLLWKNPITIAGFFVSAVSFLCIVTFGFLTVLTPTTVGIAGGGAIR